MSKQTAPPAENAVRRKGSRRSWTFAEKREILQAYYREAPYSRERTAIMRRYKLQHSQLAHWVRQLDTAGAIDQELADALNAGRDTRTEYRVSPQFRDHNERTERAHGVSDESIALDSPPECVEPEAAATTAASETEHDQQPSVRLREQIIALESRIDTDHLAYEEGTKLLCAAHAAELARREQQHTEALETARIMLQSRLSAALAEIESLRSTHENEIAVYAAEIERVQGEVTLQQIQQQHALNRLRQNYEDRLDQQRATHADELARLRAAHAAHENHRLQTHREAMERLRETYADQFADDARDHDRAMADAERRMAHERQALYERLHKAEGLLRVHQRMVALVTALLGMEGSEARRQVHETTRTILALVRAHHGEEESESDDLDWTDLLDDERFPVIQLNGYSNGNGKH